MKLIIRDPNVGYLDSLLWVPKSQINVEGTKAALTFPVNDKRVVRFLTLYTETLDHLLVPREFWDPKDMNFPIVDCRPRSFPKVDIRSHITLDAQTPGETIQQDAVRAMREARGGILQLACGKGKTVCALELAAQEKVPTLIVVDNTHLLNQWRGEIDKFLVVPGGIGMIGDGQFDWKKSVVLSTYQTLAQRTADFPQEIRYWFGLIIWDEAHHMAATTWARTADLFYGKRIGLTATPERVDGTHVIYDFHLGRTLYKDLIQELKPKIYFFWTGLEVDPRDPLVRAKVCDINGELHTSMLSSYFGEWPERLDIILAEVRRAEAQGRKALVLSYSIAELMNMFCIWSGAKGLYTQIPYPTEKDVGEKVQPQDQTKNLKRLYARRAAVEKSLTTAPAGHQQHLKQQKAEINALLTAHNVWEKCELEYSRRQRTFLKDVLKANTSNAGLMIGDIKAEERMKMLRSKQIVFAIMKYGREGLDDKAIDTIFVCEPMSQKNALQQLMGRALRKNAGKKQPVVVFFEDNIGPMMGMCQNLRGHLRSWPIEEGGPFHYDLVGHPRRGARTTWITL